MSIKPILSIAAALAFVIAAAPAQAQTPPPAQEDAQPQQQAMTVQGEIANVDPENRTLSLKIADGSDHEFRYTDETTVTGATQSAAGLATQSGRQVTIEYKEDGADRVALKIEVHAEQ